MGLRTLLHSLAEVHPGEVAVIAPDGRSWSFADLQALSSRLRPLLEGGTQRVGVRLSNGAATIAAIHGVWQAGCSVVSISPLIPEDEVGRRLKESGAGALVTPSLDCPAVEPLDDGHEPAGDEAVVMFTSGTTGRPKAASITFSALAASVRGIAHGAGLPSTGRAPAQPARAPHPVLVPVALMGGFLGCLTGWYLGKPLLICEKFSVDEVVRLAEKFRLTHLALTPAMVYDLAYHPDDHALRGVKSVTVGTAPLPDATWRRFEERYGVPVLRNYGQTEFAGAIAFERFSDVRAGNRPASTVGRVAPGVHVRILDDGGRELSEGEIGHIWARGGGSMAGYLDADGRPQDPGNAGWIATGDLGYVHDRDMLTVVGRVRDVIICGGFNIYPAQVEAALNRLPGIVESAVASLGDERLGEIPVAVLVTGDGADPGIDEVREALRRDLTAYELPRRLAVVKSLPRTELGKIDRVAVSALFRATDQVAS